MRTRGDASAHPVRRYYQHNDQTKITNKTMYIEDKSDIYAIIKTIRTLKTRRAVKSYYKQLPRDTQLNFDVIFVAHQQMGDIRRARIYRWLLNL